MSMENNNEQGQEPEQYSFLQEKIKNDAVDKKKRISGIARIVGAGLIFGVAASIGFFALKPWAETKFQKDPKEITIPKDDIINEEDNTQKETEPVCEALTLDNYRELSSALGVVVGEAEKSMVEVWGEQENQEWSVEKMNAKDSVSGLIVANNGQELLILVNSSVLKDAQALRVRFVDNTECEAVLKKQDGNIGMAILGIPKSSIKEGTWAKIKVAQLGNSNVLKAGKTLIVVGTPFAHGSGVAYGVSSSVNQKIVRADGSYNTIVTDIAGTEKGTGTIFDIDGKVVGIIHPSLFEKENSGVLTAFGISSIKSEMELLSNAKSVPYVGVIGTIVNEELSQVHNIPSGLYVLEVETDSPAMKAGIQAGDIITSVSGTKVEALAAYHNIIMEQAVGKSLSIKGQRRGAEGYVEIGFDVTIGTKE